MASRSGARLLFPVHDVEHGTSLEFARIAWEHDVALAERGELAASQVGAHGEVADSAVADRVRCVARELHRNGGVQSVAVHGVALHVYRLLDAEWPSVGLAELPGVRRERGAAEDTERELAVDSPDLVEGTGEVWRHGRIRCIGGALSPRPPEHCPVAQCGPRRRSRRARTQGLEYFLDLLERCGVGIGEDLPRGQLLHASVDREDLAFVRRQDASEGGENLLLVLRIDVEGPEVRPGVARNE